MAQDETAKPIHPGVHIKTKVLPPDLSVKGAAERLGVGRPALSNLLNGNAALSPEMALRLEKAFGASQKELLQMQAEFDRHQTKVSDQSIAVRTYVPTFLKITARDIEQWVHGNLKARSTLSVFLRKLIHSTGEQLSHVDFPGYDNAEKKGWDGRVDAGAATPWIPLGQSGWEFGCNEDPKQKAEGDYAARVAAISAHERAEMYFIFVTPRKWTTKEKWIKEKQALGEWKSVRAYDASDLEQWLEQSIPAQSWLAEQMGLPEEGAHSLDEQWQKWASVTEPKLPAELFDSSVDSHEKTLKSWLEREPSSPLVVCADSKIEALAFLSCVFDRSEFASAGYKDRAVVFSSPQTLRKLLSSPSSLIAIIFTDEVERELGGVHKNVHTIIARPKNAADVNPDIILDLLNYEAFRKALNAMGIDDHHRIEDLARESGQSPTILRRRLSKNPAIRRPGWTGDASAIRSLIPMMLVGAWHEKSNADREILSLLSGAPYSKIEEQLTELLKVDDPPVWSIGHFRGVSSKLDAFFAVQASVTTKDIEDFLVAAEIVLSESDPALDLPEDKRPFASLYGKKREFSGALREGVCETLVLLAVHGNDLFSKRLGLNLEDGVNLVVRHVLTPLTPEKLLSQSHDLPFYAEAAPEEFLAIIEQDLQSSQPQVYALMKPASTALFGGGCLRSGLLWALESLAWKPERLLRVSKILAKLAERKITDNWVNKPENSLRSIFRSWMPQTAATVEERKKVLEVLTKLFPSSGWQICLDQLESGPRVGEYSHRPRWRSDASGAGQAVTQRENYEFIRKALDLALAWPNHNERTLGDLIATLPGLPEEDQERVWDLITKWAESTEDDSPKAVLQEQIRQFAFTRRSKSRGVNNETKDRARAAYELLAPRDVVTLHRWLFVKQWVQESASELDEEDFDYEKREARIQELRVRALREIWKERGFEGTKSLLLQSGAEWSIGWHMADGVIDPPAAAAFVRECLEVDDERLLAKIAELVRGFLFKMQPDVRLKTTRDLLATLPLSQGLRLLLCSPFQQETWLLVNAQELELRQQYWREVIPVWMTRESPDINEVIDRLLAARRPRAAFHAVHFALEDVETSRLKRLMQEIGTSEFEPAGTYLLDPYYISCAMTVLQARAGVTRDEMARLEFQFIKALDHSAHGIPNLERQIVESPQLFMQVLALTFKRSDEGEDPPEWRLKTEEQRQAIFSASYALLEKIKRIPGTQDDGKIDVVRLREWITEVRSLCVQHARVEFGDRRIGQILAAAHPGDDGIWPCKPVRDVLEEIASPQIAIGMRVAVYNSRGAHARGEGGDQEREIAEKFRNWARQLVFSYPYVANLIEQIASGYEQDAMREDSETAVRYRLRR
jgi:addiction module HigA family antidote